MIDVARIKPEAAQYVVAARADVADCSASVNPPKDHMRALSTGLRLRRNRAPRTIATEIRITIPYGGSTAVADRLRTRAAAPQNTVTVRVCAKRNNASGPRDSSVNPRSRIIETR